MDEGCICQDSAEVSAGSMFSDGLHLLSIFLVAESDRDGGGGGSKVRVSMRDWAIFAVELEV